MTTFLLIIAGLMITIFLWAFLVPYFRNKITLWYVAYKFRKMAEKHTGQLREDLNGLADKIKQLNDSETFF